MEALSGILQPYKEIVGQIATTVTIGQFFSGVFVCKDIYKKGTTKGTPATPFVGGIIIGFLMSGHGLLLGDPALQRVAFAAVLFNILYTAFYYIYSSDKYNEVFKPLGIGFVVISMFVGYALIEDPKNLEYRYGFLVTALMMTLIASPLFHVKRIIREKDASSIPFSFTFMGTIIGSLWLLYGIILLNYYMIFQNVVGLTLSLCQLVLLLLYPGGQDNSDKDARKKKD